MSATLTAPASDAQLWSRVSRPEVAALAPEAARYFLSLDFTADDHARMHDLAVRGQDGALSSEEQASLAAYRRVAVQIDILQAKARLSLQNPEGSGV